MAALRCACAWILLAVALRGECADVEATSAPAPADPTPAPAPPATEAPTPAPAPAKEAPAPIPDDLQKEATKAAQDIINDVLYQLKRPDLQWVNALVAGAFGLAALYDGRRTAKAMVIMCAGVVVFYIVLSQLYWTSHYGVILKYVAASECGLFAAFCAYNGYGGHHSSSDTSFKAGSTELVLGFVVGMYLFHLVQGLALQSWFSNVAHGPWFDVVVGTMMVLLGCWAVFENQGAGRVFGLFAPLFGSSHVNSVVGYVTMLACSMPAVATYLHIEVPPSEVSPVIEFWMMIVLPMSNKEVGIFHQLGKDLVLGKTTIQLDRILGIFFVLLVWLLSATFQLKRDARMRGVENKGLKERWLKGHTPQTNV